jgi:iron(III) transport system permease protein
MMPGLVVGWTLLFVLAMGDLTASSILAGTNNPAVGLLILNIADSGTYSQLATLASVIAFISALVVTSIMIRTNLVQRRSQ